MKRRESCRKGLSRRLGGWVIVCGLSVSPAYAQSDSPSAANTGHEATFNAPDSLAPVVKKIQPDALYKQALKDERDNKWTKAIAAYEKLLRQVGDYEDARAKLEQTRQKLQQRGHLESEYAAAQAAFNNRRWTYAIVAFERILEAEQNFRDARQKLALAQKNLKRERVENIVARYYADATLGMSRSDFGMARAALQKVRELDSTYQDVSGQLIKIETLLRQQSEPAIAATAPALTDSLYRDGLAAFQKEDWLRAVISFEKLHLVQPEYRDAGNYLAQARENIGKTQFTAASVTRRESGQTSYYAGGIFAVLVLLSAIGWIGSLPNPRARFHLWRGNYLAAAKIYEKTLERHPHQVKLFLPLAEIYLRLRKNDESAMRVYKTILQLNLATRRREAINAIVAQKYLSDGRMDEDAIMVLEEALKAEQYKSIQTTQTAKRVVKELTA